MNVWQRHVLPQRDAGDRFTGDVAFTFIAMIGSFLLLIGNSVVQARLLGPEGKGLVALALLLANVLATFLSPGVVASNAFLAGRREISVRTLAGHSLTAALLGAAIGASGLVVLWMTGLVDQLLPGASLPILVILMCYLPILLYGNALGGILQGSGRIRVIQVARVMHGGVTVVATLVFVGVLDGGVVGAVGAMPLAATLLALALFGVMRPAERALLPRLDLPTAGRMLAYGMRSYLADGFQFLNYRIDLLITNVFVGPAAVGIYSVSVGLSELLFYLPNAVGFAMLPRAAASSAHEMNRLTPRVFRITLAVVVFGAFGLAVVGGRFIEPVFGERFAGALSPMLLLLPGTALLGGAKVLTNDLAGRGHPGVNSVSAGLGLVCTVVFDVLLIPKYGIVGAAGASSLSYCVVFASTVVFYRRITRSTQAADVSR